MIAVPILTEAGVITDVGSRYDWTLTEEEVDIAR